MKKSLPSLLKSLIVAIAIGTTAYAVPITGSIGFTGPYSSNNADLTLATTLTFGTIEVTGVHDGAFAGIATGTIATTPATLTINQPGVVLPANPIWSVGGFSLTLTSITEVFNNSSTLNLQGFGLISGPGYDATPGSWVGTFNVAGNNFTFSASSAATATVPEGGQTVVLLGLALLAFGLVVRRADFVRA